MSTTLISNTPKGPEAQTDARIRLVGLGRKEIAQHLTEFGIEAKKVRMRTKQIFHWIYNYCLLYTSPSPRDQRGSRMPSSA